MSEILGVLFKYLLALIAIVAVVAVLYEALGSSNASESASEISQIQANVYQLYSATPDSTTAITQTGITNVIAAGVIPSSMIAKNATSGTIANDPWGNVVGVAVTPSTGAVLALTFTAVPVSSCAKIVASALQAGVSVTVEGGTQVFPSTGDFGPTAATACSSKLGVENESITFDFYPSSSVSNNAS